LKRFTSSPGVYLLLVLLLSGPAYYLAYQHNPSLHFGIGRWDRSWLEDEAAFYPPSRMEGPLREPDGSVRVQDFVGRLTRRDAAFRLPYHALRSPLRIRVRCHRFGLEGNVALEVNGHPVEQFVFTKSSYPWGGIRSVIPQNVAEEGPLRIRLVTTGGEVPPSRLPPDLGVGVDWIELTPLSEAVLLLPTTAEWIRLYLLFFFFLLFLRFLATPRVLAPILLSALAGSVVLSRAAYPLLTSRMLELAWLAPPAVILLLWVAERADRPFTPVRPLTRAEAGG
jgi:hypothetical protein